MFFAIIPTVVYEVLGAQAALLTDCSLATYGRSGTAARPKWPLGLGLATEMASWVRARHRIGLLASATAQPVCVLRTGSGWPWLALALPGRLPAHCTPSCCRLQSRCHCLWPPYVLLLPAYDLLLPRLRATAAPPMAVQANPPSRRSVCGARAVPSAPTVRCSS